MAFLRYLTRGNKHHILYAVAQRYFSSGNVASQKHVVVVGAGYGGIKVGLDLQKAGIPYTLINPRDCMHHNLGALRAVCVPGESLYFHWQKKSKNKRNKQMCCMYKVTLFIFESLFRESSF